MLRCIYRPPFAHESDPLERARYHADPVRDRFDNFYNGYNEDCMLLRRVCCSPFPVTADCGRCCFCQNY